MFSKILTENQLKLLPLIKEFSRDYYLVGATAIALHLRHRRSIDFDLFTSGRIKKQSHHNEKFLRKHIYCFEGVDYSEKVDFVVPPVSDEEIKQFLTDVATTPL